MQLHPRTGVLAPVLPQHELLDYTQALVARSETLLGVVEAEGTEASGMVRPLHVELDLLRGKLQYATEAAAAKEAVVATDPGIVEELGSLKQAYVELQELRRTEKAEWEELLEEVGEVGGGVLACSPR